MLTWGLKKREFLPQGKGLAAKVSVNTMAVCERCVLLTTLVHVLVGRDLGEVAAVLFHDVVLVLGVLVLDVADPQGGDDNYV